MTVDTAIAVAAIVLVLLWPVHQELTIRALRHSLRRQRDQLAQHRRAIVQLQGAAIHPPTSVHAPMNDKVWSGSMATLGGSLATGGVIPASSAYRLGEGECDLVLPGPTITSAKVLSAGPACDDPDRTLRLARPPALTDIEHVLTQAGRALTATEMATQLGRQPWDLLPDIDGALKAGRIQTVPGHTAGRTAYRLADTDTLRMPHGMPLLPDTVAR